MKILSIESSADETAVAILEVTGAKPKGRILAHTVASQIELHTQYGGIFPMMAKREHAKNIFPIFIDTLKQAGMYTIAKKLEKIPEEKILKLLERENDLGAIFTSELPKIKKPKIDKIAVTVGPGLAPALWVGISFAKALATAWDIPIVPVNHMEGHLLSSVVKNSDEKFDLTTATKELPAISLLVSGGHTEIVLFKKMGTYKLVGQTRDDAAGEAFDKVARMLELPYPGGPQISKLADQYREMQKNGFVPEKPVVLPRPMIHSKDFDFSFSGLKTSVLYLIRDIGKIDDNKKMEIACEFENAVVDVLIHKTLAAIKKHNAKSIMIGGGVSANKELQTRFIVEAAKIGLPVHLPTKNLSTDNAIMIAIAGYFAKPVPISSKKLVATGNLAL